MTRRGLMTLDALHRARRGVLKFRDRPRPRPVTRRAVSAEVTLVTILRAVTCRAIERRFGRRHSRVRGRGFGCYFMLPDPG